MPKRKLEDLRREIDAIDDRIQDLILERWDVVRHVAEAKGVGAEAPKQRDPGERFDLSLPIRPAREAQMLRRLAARHTGPFPFAALARMWGEMIAAFTMLQADYSIACFANNEEHGLWDLARDQFGSQVPMTPYPTRRETLAQVFEGRHNVAVLPKPREQDEEAWWTSLAAPDAPKIMMRLPFAGTGTVRGRVADAVAVAYLRPEPTGSDRTLVIIETADQMSRAALSAVLQRAKLSPLSISSVEQDGWHHLIEIGDFLTADDPRLEMVEVRDAVNRVVIVGAYANILGPDAIARKSDDPGP